jgi:cytochrome c peroxidase
VGVAQEEYDALFGAGAFAALEVPSLAARDASPDAFRSRFLAVPSASRPGATDLGLWNVFANPAVPRPQARLRTLLGCQETPTEGDLAKTIALFKTPTLRDLGQSAPYFHTGAKDSLEAVLQHYIDFSALARAGKVRNGDRELARIQLDPAAVEPLRAFLRSLNEDYH